MTQINTDFFIKKTWEIRGSFLFFCTDLTSKSQAALELNVCQKTLHFERGRLRFFADQLKQSTAKMQAGKSKEAEKQIPKIKSPK